MLLYVNFLSEMTVGQGSWETSLIGEFNIAFKNG